jgi:hypothetical protein
MDDVESNKNTTYDYITNKKFVDGNTKNIYYTQFNFTVFIIFIIFFVVCSSITIIFIVLYLDGNEKFIYYIFIPLGILVFILIRTSFFPLFSKIIVDIPNESIIINKFTILFCLNKTNYINLKEIEKISIEKNTKVHYENNGTVYDGFNLVFIINKDKVIYGLTGEIDKNFESQKLFDFLRESLPSNIPVSSDLMEINELYPNLNTQRVVGSSAPNYINLNESSPSTALDFE